MKDQKHAVITGVSKGIGKSLCQKLLQKGAKVSGWGLTVPDFEHENFSFIKCDIRSENEVKDAFDKTISTHSHIDFLINNAGLGIFSQIENMKTEDWKKMFGVNLDGMMYCCREIVPVMKKIGGGHIINISSIAGKVGMPWGSGYNTTKYGVRGFSECLFQELRKSGIKVSAVFPGSTQTHFFDEIEGTEPNDYMLNPDELADTLIHILYSSPNYLIREIEIRPLNSKALK